jgi:hypothetical protein
MCRMHLHPPAAALMASQGCRSKGALDTSLAHIQLYHGHDAGILHGMLMCLSRPGARLHVPLGVCLARWQQL